MARGAEWRRPHTCRPQLQQWVHQHSAILRLLLHPTGEHRGLRVLLILIPNALRGQQGL